MSFVGGLLLGSFVVFHTLQQVVFKGWEHPQPEDACCVVSVVIAWLRNVQKHVLLSASGQNRDTASNKASSLTFLSFHALPTRCFLKNFECTVCFVNCVSYSPFVRFQSGSLPLAEHKLGHSQFVTQSEGNART